MGLVLMGVYSLLILSLSCPDVVPLDQSSGGNAREIDVAGEAALGEHSSKN